MGIEFNPDTVSSNLLPPQSSATSSASANSEINIAEALKRIAGNQSDDVNAAREKLNNMKASNGLTYKDAKAKMQEITDKYASKDKGDPFAEKNNPYMKMVEDEPPRDPNNPNITFSVYRFHYEIDPNKLPEPDRTDYLRAQAAVEEIETNNSSLVKDVNFGLSINLNI